MHIPLRIYVRLLRTYLAHQRTHVRLLAFLLFLTIGLQLLNPRVLQLFLDGAVHKAPLSILSLLGLLFLLVGLASQGLSVLATYLSESVAWRATNSLREDLAEHCLQLDMPFHNAHSPGEMISRLDGDVTSLANFFSQFVIRVLGNLLLLLGILLMLCFVDWRLGLGLALYTLLALFILQRTRNLAIAHSLAHKEQQAQLYGYLEERLSCLEDISSLGATTSILQGFYERMRSWLRTIQFLGLFDGLKVGVTSLALVGGTFLALGLGAYLFGLRWSSTGTLVMLFYYTQLLQAPLLELLDQLRNLQDASASITRVNALFTSTPQVHDGNVAQFPTGPLSLALSDVSFAYEMGKPVLRDITFSLPGGSVLGLLGRTGSGKTSIARLLLRLYDPQSGNIHLSGSDTIPLNLRSLRLHTLRGSIALVTQDIQLFHASLRDNLTFFDPHIPDERLLYALRETNLSEWYQSLPAGLDTLLHGNTGLSAGEAQLLTLARVFLRDPSLVILDEASSRLDLASERRLEEALDRVLVGRTVIIIAHRLATLRRADYLVILENGHIREQGARQHLQQCPDSYFTHLLHTGMEEVLA
ncbi:ABC transporter ATP-binding protein [Ktedonobacter racemifer]|uniref:ABC transporter related protein n=1 Tax=Ktedonobacter racemifer DSM 44963 TaxID=485913 RepID=D6U672_KTERA|nr:ABC transporter ATP-binding protein [Ktedonobacter racemifer]EFH80483.1 ABC transporter related protein [Ktedonobacter racemifer DSM 44963]